MTELQIVGLVVGGMGICMLVMLVFIIITAHQVETLVNHMREVQNENKKMLFIIHEINNLCLSVSIINKTLSRIKNEPVNEDLQQWFKRVQDIILPIIED